MSHPNVVRYCNWEGNSASWAGPLPSVQMVSQGQAWASPRQLRFYDPDSFVAGNIHNYLPAWQYVIGGPSTPLEHDILSFLSDGVDVRDLFAHFNGRF